MIRQAINCDICGAERLESTSYWFVADEVKGEIRLRGWESPQKSRRNARHLCGQKCVQRMMDNFTASMLAGLQAGKAREVTETSAVHAVAKPAAQKPLLQGEGIDRDDMPILERMGYDRETVAQIEADSWAGPVKPKEAATPSNAANGKWGSESADRDEKGFIHAARIKPQPLRAFQRMA